MATPAETPGTYETDVKEWAAAILNRFDGRSTLTAAEFRDVFGWSAGRMKRAIDSGDVGTLPVTAGRFSIPFPELRRYVNYYVERATEGSAA